MLVMLNTQYRIHQLQNRPTLTISKTNLGQLLKQSHKGNVEETEWSVLSFYLKYFDCNRSAFTSLLEWVVAV